MKPPAPAPETPAKTPPHSAASAEDEARELHHQPVAPALAWLLLAGFLALLTARPLRLLAGGELGPIASRLATDLTAEIPADGGAAGRFTERLRLGIDHLDRDLEKAGAGLAEGLLPAYYRAMWRLGSGHETVHVGRGGWLELRTAFDYVTGPPLLAPRRLQQPHTDPRPPLAAFAADLRRRGIALWVLPVPSKVMVHPESFAPALRGSAADLHNPSFLQLRDELEAAGLRVFDPLPQLRQVAGEQNAYFATDSHWTPPAFAAVAAALARALEQEVPLGPRDTPWRRRRQPTGLHGDLARMLNLERFLPPETAELAAIEAPTGGRLFAPAKEAEVLLLGDSYANLFAPQGADFAAQLACELGRKVDRITVNGGGASGSRHQLAAELLADPHRLDPTRVVVLEFAVRELIGERWRVVPLAAP